MKHTARYTSLNQTINEFISEAHLTNAAFYRLFQIGLNILEELGMDIYGEPTTAKLPVAENKTVELPGNYLQWLKVGKVNERGEIATLRHNPDLSKYATIADDRVQLNTGSGVLQEPDVNFRNYRYEGREFVNLYGIPGGTTYLGEFTVDDVNGLIILGDDFTDEYVFLEYLADPLGDEEYLFPIQVKPAVTAGIRYRNILSLPSGRRQNLGLIDRFKNVYGIEKRKARRRLNPVRLFEANDTIRLTNRISIKS